ncbi:MAG: hypothetical protein HY466_07330 [Deltaproteobacteria bacterium]|nr:hypothetical protein [Deltaproteobacteria bacterium]
MKIISIVVAAILGFFLNLSFALACPSGMVCPEGKECSQPSDCTTGPPTAPGGGVSTTPSTATGETSSTPTTTQEQIGQTADPKSDPNLVGVEIKPLTDRDIMDLTFGHGMVRAYLDFVNAMANFELRGPRGEMSERRMEKIRERARERADREAGVDQALDACRKTNDNYVRAHQEWKHQVKVQDMIGIDVGRLRTELEKLGDGPNQYGIPRSQIYGNAHREWIQSLLKSADMENAVTNARTLKEEAWGKYLSAQEKAGDLQQQYMGEWGK